MNLLVSCQLVLLKGEAITIGVIWDKVAVHTCCFFFLTASYRSDFLKLFDDRNFTSDRVKFNFYRDYARSKQCVSMAMQSGCAIGDLMEDDLYNPFCVDGIDPLTLPSASALTSGRFTFVCRNDFFYRKAIECEEHFLAAIYSTESDTNCGSQSESFLRCLRGNFKPCIGPSPNSILLESLSIVVLQSLQGTQLLCESPLHQIAWDDLPHLLQEVATCGDNYAAVVADCGTWNVPFQVYSRSLTTM